MSLARIVIRRVDLLLCDGIKIFNSVEIKNVRQLRIGMGNAILKEMK